MGKIFDQVLLSHLNKYPNERELLAPFLSNFDVTYAQRRIGRSTQLSIYYLKPERAIEDQFGVDSEILLAICDYPSVQVRTLQLIEDIISDRSASARVDRSVYFLVCVSDSGREWVEKHCLLNDQERIPITINAKDLRNFGHDSWYIRNIMAKQLYSRDLFSEQLPLESDTFFFGRDKIVAEFLDSIKQSKNRGLFGLRKTGKTSVLFKLKRLAEQQEINVFYYDCKDPSIRSLDWSGFLEKISTDIAKKIGKSNHQIMTSDVHVSEKFRSLLRSMTGNSRVAIIFDEIEYISPVAKLDKHWHNDFVPFWQTLWTTQSQFRKISFIVSGVNPSIVEVDIVNEVQNPMFGIVTPNYLTGLSDVDTRSMLNQLGKRMGLKFEFESLVYLFEKFGGHPLLTRMAGSYINSAVEAMGEKRPFRLTRQFLIEGQTSIDQEIAFYCRHITSELKIFYPDEYDLLEMLAAGNEADFIEFAREENFVGHLKSYGLISVEKGRRPVFKIPVLEQYVNLERMKKSRGLYEFQIIPTERRAAWLENRRSRIISDCRTLNKVSEAAGLSMLYGSNGFPESDRFAAVEIVDSREGFVNFINICNRCFMEPIDIYAKKQNLKNYFFNAIKVDYINYFDSLLRIKLYRNNEMHSELYPKVDADLGSMMERDLKGRKLSEVPEPYFILQQMVLDGLFVGLQLDIDRIS